MNESDDKKKCRINLIIETLIGTFIFLGIAVYITYHFYTPEGTPFSFAVLDKDALELWVIFALIGSFALFIYCFKQYIIAINSRKDEEYGSSKFMEEKDMPEFRKNFFFDPKVVSQCKGYKHVGEKTKWNKEELKKTIKNTRPLERELKKNPIKPFDEGNREEKAENSPGYQCLLNSQILAQDIYLSMNCKYINRNLNSIIVGGSGQGKSFSGLLPNALNANANYVFSDPSGEIIKKVGKYLESQGYEIKLFNVENMRQSQRFNPFMYLEAEMDYNILVDAINRNIKDDRAKAGGSNEFFDDAKDSFLVAVIALIKEIYPDNPERWTFFNMMELIRMAEQKVNSDGVSASSELDELFEKIGTANRRSYAYKMWRNFKVSGPKVCNEVLSSASSVYGKYFDNDEISNITMTDELNLRDIASNKKYALFISIPQNTGTYKWMASMVYSQLFMIIDKEGKRWSRENNLPDPRLPRHVSLWLDEFANTGKIPDFLTMLAVVRKYNVSINIIVQTLNQLKGMYKDSWENIIGNCDSCIYLGGQAPGDLKIIAEKLGKETIKSHSYNEGKQSSQGYQNMGRDLMTTSEIQQMARAKELVFITGCKPFRARKYDLTQHPNYKYSGEYSPDNNYNLELFDNDLDIDLIEDNTIRPEDLVNMEFEQKEYGHKRKQAAAEKKASEENKTDDKKDADSQNGTGDQPKCDNPGLSEEEKQRHQEYIDTHADNMDKPLNEIVDTILMGRDYQVFADFAPDYEFTTDNFSLGDLNLDEFVQETETVEEDTGEDTETEIPEDSDFDDFNSSDMEEDYNGAFEDAFSDADIF